MTAPRFEASAPAAGPRVQGFSRRGFVVGSTVYDGVLLTPEAALDWSPPALATLEAGHVEAIVALDPPPEFLLLGTGPAMRRPTPIFTAAVEALGFGVEAMDSRAAARAWNVLRGEDRWIVAALMPL